MDTPIAFCIFNRPELTRRVFGAIRAARPKQLLVIADGPRPTHPNDPKAVQLTRQIIETVNWPCDVQTNFSEENLGCKRRIATGLTWAFDQAERLIILEDDCLPDPSFFPFCEQLLDRFADDPQVMMISGDNFQPHQRTENSYYFSRWAHIWGWASWRRAWQHFDVDIQSWPQVKQEGRLRSIFDCQSEYQYWSQVLDRQHAGEIDTWDFPWTYAMWHQNALAVLPETNLVTNLGFGESATHTTDPLSKLANLPVGKLGPLTHPREIAPNRVADRHTWETIFQPPPAPLPKRRWYQKLFPRSRKQAASATS